MNANPTNSELVEKFLDRAKGTHEAFKARYDSAHWEDPATLIPVDEE